MVSEPAPEPPARQRGRSRAPGGPAKPKGKENVFTRKIGPLPMWVWVAIIGGLILLYALYKGRQSSSSSSGSGTRTGGFGEALLPPVVRWGTRWKLHTRYGTHWVRRDREAGGDDDDDRDKDDKDDKGHKAKHHKRGSTKPRGRKDKDHDRDDKEAADKGHAHPAVRMRARPRGAAAPGELSAFKTNSRGTPPSLQQVADGFSTSPDSIIQESSGRGVPHGPAWQRYVRQGDYSKALPNGVSMAILDRTQ